MSPAWCAAIIFAVFVLSSFGACILMLTSKGCSSIPGRARATTRRRRRI